MNTFGNQATDKLRPCGPIRSLGSSLDLVGQKFRVVVYPGAVECAVASARIGGNVDKANLLPSTRSLMGLYEFVGEPNFSGRERNDSPVIDERREPSRFDRPLPVPQVNE